MKQYKGLYERNPEREEVLSLIESLPEQGNCMDRRRQEEERDIQGFPSKQATAGEWVKTYQDHISWKTERNLQMERN